jgi:hypothetical protein
VRGFYGDRTEFSFVTVSVRGFYGDRAGFSTETTVHCKVRGSKGEEKGVRAKKNLAYPFSSLILP